MLDNGNMCQTLRHHIQRINFTAFNPSNQKMIASVGNAREVVYFLYLLHFTNYTETLVDFFVLFNLLTSFAAFFSTKNNFFFIL